MVIQPTRKFPLATMATDGLMSQTDKVKLSNTNIAYGTCATAAATASKVIKILGNENWDLTPGSIIIIKFTYTNVASNPTLNVNNKGEFPIIYNTSNISTSNLTYAGSANRYIAYVYTGSAFVFIGWSIDNNTTYSEATTTKAGLISASDKKALDILKNPSATCATARSDLDKVVSLDNFVLTTGAMITITFTDTGSSNPTSGNFTLNVNGTGAKSVVYTSNGNFYYIPYGMGWMFYNAKAYTFKYNGVSWECMDVHVNTTYSNFVKSGSTAKAGLVPAPPTTAGTTKYLREDGTWAVPPDATYDEATTTNAGLMSASDKVKLDGIDIMTGAMSEVDGSAGLVPAPAAGDQDKFLRGDGTWQEAEGKSSDSLPLAGGVVTGNVQQSGAMTDYSTYKFRNIGFGTSSTPISDTTYGGSGSIYFVYN